MSVKQLPSHRSCAGFTYIGLLIIVAIMGITMATVGTFWHTAKQRASEKQLIFVGKQFSHAIYAYYQNSPGGVYQFPKRLEDLVLDKRQTVTTRYLRKIFADPITGSTQWGLLKDPRGGITGVYSLSEMTPLKQENFPKGYGQLAKKKHYSDWQFIAQSNTSLAYGNAATSGNQLPPGNPTRGTGTVQPQPGQPVPPAQPAAPPLPPEYTPPVAPPKPQDPTPSERTKYICDLMHINDILVCGNVWSKLGDPAGAYCLSTATTRYSQCLAGEVMSVLGVTY